MAGLTFANTPGQNATIARDSGSWVLDGFAAGQTISVNGSTGNDGSYLVDSVTDSTITLNINEVLQSESDPAGNSIAIEQVYDQVQAQDVPLQGVDANGNPVPNSTSSAQDDFNVIEKQVDKTNLLAVPFNAEAIQSQSNAAITFNSGATVKADGNVDVNASATSDVNYHTPALITGIAYADSEGTAKAVINSGVTIAAGGSFTLNADVNNTMKAEVQASSGLVLGNAATGNANPLSKGPQTKVPGPALTVAYGYARSTSEADLDSGATVTAKGVSITSANTNDFEVKADSKILFPGSNQGFAAAAVSDVGSSATTDVGGTVTDTGGGTTIDANSDNLLNRAQAVASVKQQLPGGAVSSSLSDTVKQANLDNRSNPGAVGASAAVTIASSTNTATTDVQPTARVNVTGALSVTSEATDNFQNEALGVGKSEAEFSLAGAVAYTNYTNTATTSIDSGATVNASGALTVKADAEIPIQVQLTNDIFSIINFRYNLPSFNTSGAMPFFKSAYDFGKAFVTQTAPLFGLLAQYANTRAGAPNTIATTYVAAGATAGNADQGSPGEFSLSGTFNLLTVTNTADTSIDGGARVNTDPSFESSAQSVNVEADAKISTVNMGGFRSLKSAVTGTTKSTGSELGGTYLPSMGPPSKNGGSPAATDPVAKGDPEAPQAASVRRGGWAARRRTSASRGRSSFRTSATPPGRGSTAGRTSAPAAA